MSSKPRGFCLIINNMDFGDPKKNRSGSDKDEESLKEVFESLGFSVEVRKDKTTDQMKDILKTFGQKQHEGDGFICCILSHGAPNGVYGTDGRIISRDDIFRPFYGISCPSLKEKPKVFFIQTCRGKQLHPVDQADDYMEDTAGEEKEEEDELKTDAEQIVLNEADFFIARSTIKGYYSVRNTGTGSWFIQALCKQLETCCAGGTDINIILAKTNEEVSRRVTAIRINNEKCLVAQMPVYKSTLRKSLVFRPV